MATGLDSLADGQSAVVSGLGHGGPAALRLMELGLHEGAVVTVLRRAPLGDPLELKVGDFRLALRREDARLVQVDPA